MEFPAWLIFCGPVRIGSPSRRRRPLASNSHYTFQIIFKVGSAPRANTERYLRQLTAAVNLASQIYNFGRIVSIFIDGWLWLELKSLAENGHIFLLNGPVDEEKESLFTRMAIASMSDKGPP